MGNHDLHIDYIFSQGAAIVFSVMTVILVCTVEDCFTTNRFNRLLSVALVTHAWTSQSCPDNHTTLPPLSFKLLTQLNSTNATQHPGTTNVPYMSASCAFIDSFTWRLDLVTVLDLCRDRPECQCLAGSYTDLGSGSVLPVPTLLPPVMLDEGSNKTFRR